MNDLTPPKPLVLIVDDEPNIRLLLTELLSRRGLEVVQLDNGHKVLDFIKKNQVAFTILDIRMPGVDGLEVLRSIRTFDPNALVIMLTAFATIKTAVEAIKIGAFDYLTKPFEMEDLMVAVDRVLKVWKLIVENQNLKAMVDNLPGNMFFGNSVRMRNIQAMLEKVAICDHTVLISGETGTGKSMLAKAIHQYSNRRDRPFVWLNCAALPENLIESELFGYEKGAFTGAAQQKKGLLETADEGTLFMDEISILSPSAQGKLLLALQEREFQRVGGNKPIRVDVRIIAASNQNLKSMVEKGEFRPDLFYRLSVINLEMPSLKDRFEDIIPLTQYFISKFGLARNINYALNDDIGRKLLNYSWPGNIRELENVVKQALVLAGDNTHLVPEYFLLSEDVRRSMGVTLVPGETLKETLGRFEREVIAATMANCNNQVTLVAEKLGVSVRTIYRYL